MLISHLPAGYLVTKFFVSEVLPEKFANTRVIWVFGLLFSVIPDFDLFYFYFFDSSQHHHKLFPHIPLFWVAICLPLLLLGKILKNVTLFYIAFVSSLSIFIHLVLDTFVGYVWWLYPIIDKPYYLIKIPASYGHWIISFVLHWSFLVELVIVGAAIYVYFRKGR